MDEEDNHIDNFGANAGQTNEEISAYNLEIGYAFAMGEKEAVVAAALQGSEDAEDLIPETRYLGSFAFGFFESTTLAFEYAHSEFENDDEEDAFTAQLAIEFYPVSRRGHSPTAYNNRFSTEPGEIFSGSVISTFDHGQDLWYSMRPAFIEGTDCSISNAGAANG